jgi:hypothetical protein
MCIPLKSDRRMAVLIPGVKAELVDRQGAFPLHEKGVYRVKVEDWQGLNGRVLLMSNQTETRDGIQIRIMICLVKGWGELGAGVSCRSCSAGVQDLNIVDRFEVKKPGKDEMIELKRPRQGIQIVEPKKIFENFAENGYVTFRVTLKISKKQDETKLAQQKLWENLAKDVGKLLGDEGTSDFTVECQGQRFPCHRAVLAARSSTFASGFRSGLEEGEGNKWVVQDADPADVKDMLVFLYTGNIPEAVKDRPVELLELALKYHLPDLAPACRQAVVAGLTPGNVVQRLVELDRYKETKDDESKQAAIDFIKKHSKEVTKSPEWPLLMKNYGSLVTEIVLSLSG